MHGIATKFAPGLEAYELACQAGFSRAELWLDDRVLADWEGVVNLSNQFHMDHAIHFPNRLEQTTQTLENLVNLHKALKVRAVIIHQPHMDRYAEKLRQLDPAIPLAVENHKLNREQFDRWADTNLGLTLDVEHYWKFTLQNGPLVEVIEGIRRFLQRHAKKLLHVHMPGYLPGQPEHRPMYCSRDLVFEVLNLLAEYHFEGLVVSETNVEFQNIDELQMDTLLFRRWFTLRQLAIPARDG